MKVLSVTSEIYPLVKTGGLADVAGALPGALHKHGAEVLSLIPGYPAVMAAMQHGETIHQYTDLLGGPARLVKGKAKGQEVIAVDAHHLFDRPGNPYLGPNGKDWPDNAQRFAGLARAAADIGQGKVKAYVPDLLHLHDWQAALAAVYVKYEGGPRTIVTVHNIAFQGQYPASVFAMLGLPPQAFSIDGLEYYGNVSYLKGGLSLAEAITTVSPSYAQEICTPEFGMGLDGLLRARRSVVSGIVNGIDTDVWNPAADDDLVANYNERTLPKRAANKRALEQRFGLEPGDGILHCVVSRLTWQKGMDILAGSLDQLVASGARLAMIGSGEAAIEKAFLEGAQRHGGRVGVVTAYDEKLSHLMQGGGDTIVIPSRFEPCGLTQLYGLRYGCVPIVARTGGLADTIIDANDAALAAGVATGLQFSPVDGPPLEAALVRAARVFGNRQAWSTMQRRGMESDVSWDHSAEAYADLYRNLLGRNA